MDTSGVDGPVIIRIINDLSLSTFLNSAEKHALKTFDHPNSLNYANNILVLNYHANRKIIGN